MAGANGHADHPLVRTLLSEGRRFGFFQAVRLLHDLQPDRPAVGRQGPPGREPVRLAGWLSLSFEAGEVAKVEPHAPASDVGEGGEGGDGAPPDPVPPFRLESPLVAIYGTASPLPTCYTEALLEQDDATERSFLDLFQHRLLSLLYRTWARYRWEVGFRQDGADFFTDRVSRAVGLGPGALPEGHRGRRLELVALAGLLSLEPRGAAGMELALRRAFPGCQVAVEPFALRWAPLPEGDLSRLGGARCALGQTAILGERVQDRAGTFRVVVTAPDSATYLAFLEDDADGVVRRPQALAGHADGPVVPGAPPAPDRAARSRLLPRTTESPLAALRELIDLFNPDLLDCELELRLDADAVLQPRLGARDVRLGWSSWIGRPAPEQRWIRRIFQGAFHG